jgi:flavin-binding protein dodecin
LTHRLKLYYPGTRIVNERLENRERRKLMDSTYKVIELIGTSPTSWEEAAKNAVATAGKSLKDLRIAEAVEFDMKVEDDKVVAYRTKVKISFKYKE